MRVNKKCPICGKGFVAIKTTQLYDKRSCFKRAYYVKTKSILEDAILHPHFPNKKCSFCLAMGSLNFDPIKFPHLFNSWECGKCGVSNQLVWKYQEKDSSHQIIENIVVSMKIHRLDPIPQIDLPFTNAAFYPLDHRAESTMVIITFPQPHQK